METETRDNDLLLTLEKIALDRSVGWTEIGNAMYSDNGLIKKALGDKSADFYQRHQRRLHIILASAIARGRQKIGG